MNFLRQGFRKLSSDRQTDRQTPLKLYTTPLRGWPITVAFSSWWYVQHIWIFLAAVFVSYAIVGNFYLSNTRAATSDNTPFRTPHVCQHRNISPIADQRAVKFDNYAAFLAVAEPEVVLAERLCVPSDALSICDDKVLAIHSLVALSITSQPDDDVSCSSSKRASERESHSTRKCWSFRKRVIAGNRLRRLPTTELNAVKRIYDTEKETTAKLGKGGISDA